MHAITSEPRSDGAGGEAPASNGRVLDAAPHDRDTFVRLARHNSPHVEVEHHHPRGRARIEVGRAGRIGLTTLAGPGTTFRRSPRAAGRDHDPSLVLALQERGTTELVLTDRSATLPAGSLSLHCTTQASVRRHGHGSRVHYVYLPLDRLGLPSRTVLAATGTVLDPARGVAALAWVFFDRLADCRDLWTQASGDSLTAPGVELARALVLTHGTAETARTPHTLTEQIMGYVRAHLADKDLSPARIAAVHHISVRYLYLLLSRHEVSLGEWIRRERLEECRRDLARTHDERTVAAVADAWGFTNAAHFSRSFKAAYGMSPRQWRDLNHSRSTGVSGTRGA